MIPKIIHYCWFGKGEKGKKIEKYINTWKEKMPDYKIIEWNETNFNIESNEYVKKAYDLKKYAFVSDYVRLQALYNYGGIYFDTDIEVVENFDEFLEKDKNIFGFELEHKVMTGVMISMPKSNIIKEFLNYYNNKKIINEFGNIELIPNTTIFTELLLKKGLILNNKEQEFSDFIIYPIEFFTGFDLKNSCVLKTEDTKTIHHYNYSWSSPKLKLSVKLKRIFSKILGRNVYNKLRLFKKKLKK